MFGFPFQKCSILDTAYWESSCWGRWNREDESWAVKEGAGVDLVEAPADWHADTAREAENAAGNLHNNLVQ